MLARYLRYVVIITLRIVAALLHKPSTFPWVHVALVNPRLHPFIISDALDEMRRATLFLYNRNCIHFNSLDSYKSNIFPLHLAIKKEIKLIVS